MTYIFLSYAKADRDTAFAMRDVLRREGLGNVWMDENLYELNNEHWPVIEANILSAGAFVLLLSDAAKESKWVNRELTYAEQIQKPIFSILIQGEGWERLEIEPIRPSLGASLDLPDEFAALVKTLDSPYANLPEQIPANTVKAAGKPPYKLVISIALVLAVLVMLMRIYNSATEANYEASLTSDAETREGTDTYAGSISLDRTDVVAMAATSLANSAATEIAATATIEAIRTERVTVTAIAANTRQANMNLTASARNGTFPCTARLNGEAVSRLAIYREPNLSLGSLRYRREVAEDETFMLVQWVENRDGAWYGVRFDSESLVIDGYVRAEALILGEECPR